MLVQKKIPTLYIHDFKVKVTYLEFLCLKFYNVRFCEAFHGLIHVWHGDRNWSKILYGTITDLVHDFKVKVTDLEFYIKVLR